MQTLKKRQGFGSVWIKWAAALFGVKVYSESITHTILISVALGCIQFSAPQWLLFSDVIYQTTKCPVLSPLSCFQATDGCWRILKMAQWCLETPSTYVSIWISTASRTAAHWTYDVTMSSMFWTPCTRANASGCAPVWTLSPTRTRREAPYRATPGKDTEQWVTIIVSVSNQVWTFVYCLLQIVCQCVVECVGVHFYICWLWWEAVKQT